MIHRKESEITIKRIAELADTSRGTVDRVLHKRGKVSGELEERVLAIAREHNYRSNPHARALVRSGKKSLIGVIMNSRGNKFFRDVLSGINDTIEKYRSFGFDLHVTEIKGYREDEQIKAIEDMMSLGPAALAITPIDTKSVADKLSALPVPVVTFNNDLPLTSKLAFVGCDYQNSGKICGDIAKILLPSGGKAGIITGSFLMRGHNDRIKGFEEVMKDTAIKVVGIVEDNDDNHISKQVTEEFIREHDPDLLYFCAAGTEGGMKAVLESGKDIKVIVVDDIKPMHEYLKNGEVKAIVTQQPYRQGSKMVEILCEYLMNGRAPERSQYYTENVVLLPHSLRSGIRQ